MLRTLDLIWNLSKGCLMLTLVRLLTTAFGWEFGISRQYLRLLEWLLDLGQQRIERCESEHRLQLEMTANGHLEKDTRPESPRQLKLGLEENNCQHPDGKRRLGGPKESARKRPVGITLSELNAPLQTSTRNRAGSAITEHKRRRISTPDGPPVFLFDYEDDEEEVTGLKEVNSKERQQNTHNNQKHEFHLEDPAKLVVRGIAAIIDDEVTKRFTHEELKTWNLLTRTNAKNYQFMSRSLGLCWLSGFVIRYSLLFPLRIMFTITGFVWLILTMSLIGLLPRKLRYQPYRLTSLMSFRMLSCGITSRLHFHNRQYRAQKGDICVANHTSPLDVVLLACDNCYALVGQRHGGLLGLLEMALSRATQHVWFDRDEMRDRQLVTKRLREHVSGKTNLPVLIFPEGTCINNSAVMMFRKGSFETTDRVCPVAIKYDARFGDPFWNSSKQSYVQYLLMVMSSWAIKCDVWYLAPMNRLPGESSAEFANRVKAEIAKQGGLEDLAWDGQLKRSSVKPTWMFQQQEDYVKRLKLD